MVRILAMSFVALLTSRSLAAATPSTVVVGAIVNTWTQAGLRVTDKPFDLAIQGTGFFVLRLSSGEQVFSRYGEMSVDANGYLTHTATKGAVLGFCGSEIEPINLSRFARDADGSVVKSFQTNLNGSIKAIYENGYARDTCTVGVARFRNPTRLRRTGHLLQSTAESGSAFMGAPQTDGMGSIYAATLEELDEQMYRLNIKANNTDRVADEMEKQRVANEQWSKQKTLFYVYDLGVTRQELSVIDVSTEKCGKAIKSVVGIAEKAPSQISDDEFSSRIKSALDQHESEVMNVLGQERLDKAKAFRDAFNKEVWNKFGTSLRFTAF